VLLPVRVALQALAKSDAGRRVLAVPVAPAELVGELKSLCDEAVILLTPRRLGAVAAFYEEFQQTQDAEVISLLDRAAARSRSVDAISVLQRAQS
jgi:putative phosphoribosyl transferase